MYQNMGTIASTVQTKASVRFVKNGTERKNWECTGRRMVLGNGEELRKFTSITYNNTKWAVEIYKHIEFYVPWLF